MLFSFGAFIRCFDQSTVGCRHWSVFGEGVFGGPLSSRGLLFGWITLPGAWTLRLLLGC